MEISYAEAFLLAWALVSSVCALLLRERLNRFVMAGSVALEACKFMLDDIADGKVTVKRVDGKIEVVNLITGEENAVQIK
jgi:hypothetical protein